MMPGVKRREASVLTVQEFGLDDGGERRAWREFQAGSQTTGAGRQEKA